MKSASASSLSTLIPASVVLQQLHDEAPTDHFTLSWLMQSLRSRSFGIILLLLAVAAIVPGVAMVAGILIMLPACQMITGRLAPSFPRRIAARPLPTRHLAALLQRAVPVLRFLERLIYPRWPMPHEASKRLVGAAVLLLTTVMLFNPIPLSNIVPALVMAIISLAYLEEDGLMLSVALVVAVLVLTAAFAAVWVTVLGAQWIGRFW
jgi:hypothetical protein